MLGAAAPGGGRKARVQAGRREQGDGQRGRQAASAEAAASHARHASGGGVARGFAGRRDEARYSRLLVMRSISAIAVKPSRTFSRPSSRRRRLPSLTPTETITSP